MASTVLETGALNAMMDALDAYINGGGGAAYLEFQTSASAEVATLTMSTTAFGDSDDGVLTSAAITSDDDATGGIATKVVLKLYDDTPVATFDCDVSGNSPTFVVSTQTIGEGDTVSIGVGDFTMTLPDGS